MVRGSLRKVSFRVSRSFEISACSYRANAAFTSATTSGRSISIHASIDEGAATPIIGVFHQRSEAIKPVDELAVRQGEKQAQHDAKVQREQQAHELRVAQEHQREAGEAGEEQHREERAIHARWSLIGEDWVAAQLQREQAGW